MFSAQLTGTISRSPEKKDSKFGKAFTFGIETKNKKGESLYINCIQYGETKNLSKGSKVYVSGDIDIGEYKGKPSVNVLARNLELLSEAESKQEEEIDDIPF